MAGVEPQTSRYGVARWTKDAMAEIPERVCLLLNLPGVVQPIDYPDMVTGDRIRVQVGKRFTVISVNNRDYYFKRFTGRFDGTGYVCPAPKSESLYCTPADILGSTRPLSWWGRLRRLLLSRG